MPSAARRHYRPGGRRVTSNVLHLGEGFDVRNPKEAKALPEELAA